MGLDDIVEGNKEESDSAPSGSINGSKPDNPHSEEYRYYEPGYDDKECPACGELGHRAKDPADGLILDCYICVNDNCEHQEFVHEDMMFYGSYDTNNETPFLFDALTEEEKEMLKYV